MTDAREITTALRGRWHGSYGTCACPVCQPEQRKGQNALTLADGRNGRLLLDCKKNACAFLDILTAAGLRSGDYRAPAPATIALRKRKAKLEAEKRAAQAKRLWQEAQPIEGTLAETYLRTRGITGPLPRTLRFHGSCWHGPSAKRHPVLMAAVQGLGLPAVHRTYLRPDGGTKADIAPAKAMLGATTGGAVRLTESSGALVVAEGLETALSLSSDLLKVSATVWAALSTSGMRGMSLPPRAGQLTIASDGDKAGREAAHVLADRAASLGWRVTLLPAPEGLDWNDVLMMKGEAA